jgi:hypothetical protein
MEVLLHNQVLMVLVAVVVLVQLVAMEHPLLVELVVRVHQQH